MLPGPAPRLRGPDAAGASHRRDTVRSRLRGVVSAARLITARVAPRAANRDADATTSAAIGQRIRTAGPVRSSPATSATPLGDLPRRLRCTTPRTAELPGRAVDEHPAEPGARNDDRPGRAACVPVQWA